MLLPALIHDQQCLRVLARTIKPFTLPKLASTVCLKVPASAVDFLVAFGFSVSGGWLLMTGIFGGAPACVSDLEKFIVFCLFPAHMLARLNFYASSVEFVSSFRPCWRTQLFPSLVSQFVSVLLRLGRFPHAQFSKIILLCAHAVEHAFHFFLNSFSEICNEMK